MTRNLLCAIYLLIAISAVHSASYYRYGREVVVPIETEVKEIISEYKKDEPIVEEIVAIAAEPEMIKNIPIVESMMPVVETVENNVVADGVAEKVIAEFASDEGRAKANPVLRFDALEVIQPGGKSDKVTTVAETVKNAAVEAIEKQNQEVAAAESVKVEEPIPEVKDQQVVDAAVVKSVPNVDPDVESVNASAKSPEPVVAVKEESVVLPAVVVEKVVEKESVRSADPEPAKPEEPSAKPDEPAKLEESPKSAEPAKEEKVKPDEPAKEEKAEQPQATEPAVRQQSPPGPLDQITNAISSIATNFQNAGTNFQNTITNLFPNNLFAGNRPQSDATSAEDAALNTAEQAPSTASAAIQSAAPVSTTASPNILQNIQQAITQFTNNIIPANLRPTTAPSAAVPEVPIVVGGTRVGEEEVQVVENIDVVNDKIDLGKQKQ